MVIRNPALSWSNSFLPAVLPCSPCLEGITFSRPCAQSFQSLLFICQALVCPVSTIYNVFKSHDRVHLCGWRDWVHVCEGVLFKACFEERLHDTVLPLRSPHEVGCHFPGLKAPLTKLSIVCFLPFRTVTLKINVLHYWIMRSALAGSTQGRKDTPTCAVLWWDHFFRHAL